MENFVDLASDTPARVAPRARPDADTDPHHLTLRDRALMRELRHQRHENQTEFWQRFGVAQSSGSRFERGMPVPQPILLLVRLYFQRLISDQDLQRVRSADYERPQLDTAGTG